MSIRGINQIRRSWAQLLMNHLQLKVLSVIILKFKARIQTKNKIINQSRASLALALKVWKLKEVKPNNKLRMLQRRMDN